CRLCDLSCRSVSPSFFFTAPATPEIYTLSLHDALPICSDLGTSDCPATCGNNVCEIGEDATTCSQDCTGVTDTTGAATTGGAARSEEHTSELQSRENLVCRLLLEKKKQQ